MDKQTYINSDDSAGYLLSVINSDDDTKILFENLVYIVENNFDIQKFESQFATIIELLAEKVHNDCVNVEIDMIGNIEAQVGNRKPVELNTFQQSLNGLLLMASGDGIYTVSSQQFVLERINAQVDILVKSQ